MKHAVILTVVIMAFLSALLISELQINDRTNLPMDTVTLNLSSDKNVYHSAEQMKLNAEIKTLGKLENVTVRVYGVRDRRGGYRVNEEKIINVDPPGIEETFEFRMPSCYGCAGVSPGDYEIVMEILKEGEVIGNFSKTIKLEK